MPLGMNIMIGYQIQLVFAVRKTDLNKVVDVQPFQVCLWIY